MRVVRQQRVQPRAHEAAPHAGQAQWPLPDLVVQRQLVRRSQSGVRLDLQQTRAISVVATCACRGAMLLLGGAGMAATETGPFRIGTLSETSVSPVPKKRKLSLRRLCVLISTTVFQVGCCGVPGRRQGTI